MITIDEALANSLTEIPLGVETYSVVVWGLNALCLITCVSSCLLSSKLYAEDQYLEGHVALTSAAIAGAAPKLAAYFLY